MEDDEVRQIFRVIETEIAERLRSLAGNGSWRNYHGQELTDLQDLICEKFEQEFVHLCASGTYAVELALRGLQVGSDDFVLLAGYDFPGNFRAIEAVGAKPVLMDIDPSQWVIQRPDFQFRKAKVIIVSPLYGSIPEMSDFRNWCNETDTQLLLDICQCPGASWNEDKLTARSLTHWADASCFSFGGSKILSAGRGGAVTTCDAGVAQRMKVVTDRGNDFSPLSLLQATVLIPQIENLDATNAAHRELIRWVSEWTSQFGFLVDPFNSTNSQSRLGQRVYYKKAWMLPEDHDRDNIIQLGLERAIPLGAGFRGFAKRSRRRCEPISELENSKAAADRTLLLHHSYLDKGDIQMKKKDLCSFFAELE